jgi:hypothetical protein
MSRICAAALFVAFACVPAHADNTLASFRDRLIALHPDRPMDYFELAEEIAYEVPTDVGRRLAAELLVLAGELDRASSQPVPLARSVCLALADLSTDSAERTWLIAMARAQTPAGEVRDASTVGAGAGPTDAELGARAVRVELAMALARFRGADVRPLRALLESGDAARVIAQAGVPQADAFELLSLVAARIPEMRRLRARDSDGRVVRSLTEGATSYSLDPITRGHPGPVLTEEQTVLVLGIEARLLGARPESWAADLEVTRRQPVRDINPASLAPYFAVDPERVWFVIDPARPDDPGTGSWSASPPNAPASPDPQPDERIDDQPDQQDGQVDDRRDEQPLG